MQCLHLPISSDTPTYTLQSTVVFVSSTSDLHMTLLMFWLFKLIVIVAYSPCRAVSTTHVTEFADPCRRLPTDYAPEATHTIAMTCLPQSTGKTSSHVLNGITAFAHETKPQPTVLVASIERNASDITATVTLVDPDLKFEDVSENGGSRLLSVIFFAVSALLTLATIVVAVLYGSSAAHAGKRLSNI